MGQIDLISVIKSLYFISGVHREIDVLFYFRSTYKISNFILFISCYVVSTQQLIFSPILLILFEYMYSLNSYRGDVGYLFTYMLPGN